MTYVVVDVKLKPEILDPQGRAILGALGRVGLPGRQRVHPAAHGQTSNHGGTDFTALVERGGTVGGTLVNLKTADVPVQEGVLDQQ